MAKRQHAGYERRGLLGRILVTLGSVALLADLSFLAQPLERLAERLGQGLFALLPTLGLSFLNAARAIAFGLAGLGLRLGGGGPGLRSVMIGCHQPFPPVTGPL